jgi:hypothetical protein
VRALSFSKSSFSKDAVLMALSVQFSPLILSGFGYSKEMTVLLAAPQGAVALVVQVAASLITLYVKNVRCLLWTVSCLPALVGVFIIRCTSITPREDTTLRNMTDCGEVIDVHQHRITALMGLYLTGFYNVSWVMAMSLISSNTAGGTKKSFGSASMAIFYGNVTLQNPAKRSTQLTF